jgi:hypothetical protein
MSRPVLAGTPSALLGLLLIFVHAGPAPGQPHADKALHPDHGEKQIHKAIGALEDEWHSAMLTNDTGTVDRLLADDFVGIGPDGTISSKADELAARRGGLRKFSQLDVLERKIRVYGTTAVVTSRAVVAGVYDDMPLTGEFRYTRVYNLSHGQWRIVSFEASPVTAGRKQH